MEKVSRFDRISRRGVHLPFEGVQPGSKGVQIPKGVQSERLDCPDKLEVVCLCRTQLYRTAGPSGYSMTMEEMGKRKLAYEINYISEGYYVLVKFTSSPEFPAELDRVLGITDGVMRSLITLRAE